MQKIIDQITDNLSGLVTQDLPAYTPKELLQAGIPSFIVERIRIITEDLLHAEVHRPNSIWANLDNELVNYAWQDLLDCIYSSSHVPKDYLYSTLSIVVEEVMEVLLEPRHKMADYLFRNHEVLSFSEIAKRCNRLTIYKHIGVAIPMYMTKRGLEELSHERCKKLIIALDEKLVANYTADDWAEKLEVLFIIFGGKVAPDMFATFFQDKGLNRASRYFNELEEPLSRTEFIEFMKNKGISDLAGDEDDKEFVDKKLSKKSTAKEDASEEKKEELVNDYFGEYSEKDQTLVKQYTIDNDISEKEMQAILRDIEGKSSKIDKESLNALFVEDEDDDEIIEKAKKQSSKEPNDEEMKAFRNNLVSVLDQAKSSYKSLGEEQGEGIEEAKDEEPVEEVPEEKNEEPIVEESSDDLGEDEEEPMWAQFLSKEQMEVMMAKREGEPEKSASKDKDELVVEDEDDDLIIEAEQETPYELALKDYLNEDEKKWKKTIFGGKAKSYNAAVKKIESYDNWEKASKHVESKVFAESKVDMLSEEAIEFIDALQGYFKEHKS